MAQWKRAGPITQRSVDGNHALLTFVSFGRFFCVCLYFYLLCIYVLRYICYSSVYSLILCSYLFLFRVCVLFSLCVHFTINDALDLDNRPHIVKMPFDFLKLKSARKETAKFTCSS